MAVRHTDAAGHGTAAGAAAADQATRQPSTVAGDDVRPLGLGAAAVVRPGQSRSAAAAHQTTGRRRRRSRHGGHRRLLEAAFRAPAVGAHAQSVHPAAPGRKIVTAAAAAAAPGRSATNR